MWINLRQRFAEEFPGTQFFFQPADMVTQILNFGQPAPIDIRLIGPNQQANYLLAQLDHGVNTASSWRCRRARTSDVLDTPRSSSTWTAPGRSRWDCSEQDVANSLLLTLSSSFQVNPSVCG